MLLGKATSRSTHAARVGIDALGLTQGGGPCHVTVGDDVVATDDAQRTRVARPPEGEAGGQDAEGGSLLPPWVTAGSYRPSSIG